MGFERRPVSGMDGLVAPGPHPGPPTTFPGACAENPDAGPRGRGDGRCDLSREVLHQTPRFPVAFSSVGSSPCPFKSPLPLAGSDPCQRRGPSSAGLGAGTAGDGPPRKGTSASKVAR